MKLISLAALSFLAITVSAYPGLGTPHQGAGAPSAEQSQNTGTPSAEQCQNAAERNAVQYQFCLIQRARQRYEQELQAESQMLAKLYREEQGLAHDMGALLIEMEREQLQLREVISGLEGNIPEQDKVMRCLLLKI
ncbi:hypothetical protein BASA61_005692 [Batrachochytrium salamandrivorans]|nr:hypothetical protein BASA61_005692 [Batrachochytrium salamandrivorans]